LPRARAPVARVTSLVFPTPSTRPETNSTLFRFTVRIWNFTTAAHVQGAETVAKRTQNDSTTVRNSTTVRKWLARVTEKWVPVLRKRCAPAKNPEQLRQRRFLEHARDRCRGDWRRRRRYCGRTRARAAQRRCCGSARPRRRARLDLP